MTYLVHGEELIEAASRLINSAGKTVNAYVNGNITKNNYPVKRVIDKRTGEVLSSGRVKSDAEVMKELAERAFGKDVAFKIYRQGKGVLNAVDRVFGACVNVTKEAAKQLGFEKSRPSTCGYKSVAAKTTRANTNKNTLTAVEVKGVMDAVAASK